MSRRETAPMELVNTTSFMLDRFVTFDRDGAETFVVVLKATWDLDFERPPRIAEEQDPITVADEYADEPATSGLLKASDFSMQRPATDITFTACAVAPDPRTISMDIACSVGNVVQHARVTGDRRWTSVLGFTKIENPKPFELIPLTWENCFGGSDATHADEKHHDGHDENPVGKGFFAKRTGRKVAEAALPNIEHPVHAMRSPFDRVPSVGFAPVAPGWMPRRSFAGTYDEAWVEQRAPLLPDDFDSRFFQTAPPALIAEGHLRGGERCILRGMTRPGTLAFNLPRVEPSATIHFANGSSSPRLALDSVHIDTTRMKLNLTWHGEKSVHGHFESIKALEAAAKLYE